MRIVFLLTAIILFLFTNLYSTVSAQPYAIGLRTATFVDAARSNRNIAVEVRYPATSTGTNTAFASGQFPVIVFGHGFSMGIAAYTNIWQFLVPQGYVVVMVNTETGLSPNHDNFGKDLAFCVNQMQLETANNSSPYFGKLTDRTAIMGHSMGGGCTVLAAANNNSITTIVGLAAAETNPSAAAAAATVSVPALIVAGQNDCVTPQSDHQIPIYNALPVCKYYAEIKDGIHCDFTNGNGAFPGNPAFNCYFGGVTCGNGNGSNANQATQQARMEAIVLPWLNFWLKDNCTAWTTFTDALPNTANYSSYQSSCTDPLPTAVITYVPTNVCSGQTVNLLAAGGGSYLWNNGVSTQGITATPTGTTVYSVTVTDARGCTDTQQSVVTVASLPLADAGSDQTICSGENAVLNAAAGASAYTWSTGQTGQSINVTPTTTTTYGVTVSNSSGCTASDNAAVNVITNCTYLLQGHVWLQGPYLSAAARMDTTLRNKELLPLAQPYSGAPWYYTGTESVGSIMDIPANVCDWILVEARKNSDTSLVERHAVWVLSDGRLMDIDGSNGLVFDNLNSNSTYFISIRHRNHLDILSNDALSFGAGIPTYIDFANPANVENGSSQLINTNGIWAMLGGDNDGNGNITPSDFGIYANDAGSNSISHYSNRADVDLNRVVSYRDYNFYRANIGRTSIPLLRY